MKIYISAKFERSVEVKELGEHFEKQGHKLVNHWITHKSIWPYAKNSKTAREYAIEDLSDTIGCDVFVFLCGEVKSGGMHVELGAAIASAVKTGKPKIYVVGETNDSSIFYFHPTVERKSNVHEVIAELEKLF